MLKKNSIGFKIGIVMSLLHLGSALYFCNIISHSHSSTAAVLFVPFMVLDAPISFLVFFLGELGSHISPVVQFGVLGSMLWFLIPWGTGRLIERIGANWSGWAKGFTIIGTVPLFIVAFYGLVSVEMTLRNRDRRPVELRQPLDSPASGYLNSRVVFTENDLEGVVSIKKGLWRADSGLETVVTFNRGVLFFDDDYELQHRIELSNHYASLFPVGGAEARNFRLLAYRHFRSATLLDSKGDEVWSHSDRSEGEGPIDGTLCGDIDGDGVPEFAVHRRYRDGIKLLDNGGKTRWTYPVSSIGHIVMADVRGNGKQELFFKDGRDFKTLDAEGTVVDKLQISKASSEFSLIQWPGIKKRPNILLPGENEISIVDMKGNSIIRLDAPGCRSFGKVSAEAVRFKPDGPAHLAVRKILHPDVVALYVYDANGTLVFQDSGLTGRGTSFASLLVTSIEGSSEERLLAGQWQKSKGAQLVEYSLSPDAVVAPKYVKPVLFPEDAVIEGSIQVENKPTGQCLGYWNNPEDAIRFNISNLEKGKYEVIVKYATPDEHGGTLAIKLNDQVIEQYFGTTGGWNTHDNKSIGFFEHDGGSASVTLSILKSNIENVAVMNFFSLTFNKK